MRPTILALSFAGLCVPGIALAQDNAEVLRTTPGAHCTGDVVDSQCTLTNTEYAAGNLAGQTGTEGNAMPTATGTTGGSSGVLNPTPPAGSLGTGGSGNEGGGSMGGGSSGGSSY